MPSLPPLIDWSEIQDRLQAIFPEGTPHRGYVVREMAAKSVFAMLYIGAVGGSGTWIRPVQIVRMTDEQAEKQSDLDRQEFAQATPARLRNAWYADNSREPVRDETLRQGLIPLGAVIERSGLPTTSSKGRYALAEPFARLFAPALSADDLTKRIREWQRKFLTPGALARIRLMRESAAGSEANVRVSFPDGSIRLIQPGPSSVISKAVIEDFAARFLSNPVVLWLSESGDKVAERDDELASRLDLDIRPDKNLPDIILVDLLPEEPGRPPVLFVFVEVVATEGAMTEQRRRSMVDLVTDAGYDPRQAAFVTAYSDRGHAAFRRTFPALAWESFAWCRSEPDRIIYLADPEGREDRKLFSILFP